MASGAQTVPPDLLLTEGGPGDALMHRLHLLRPEDHTATLRTAAILAAITWLPLCVISIVQGLAFGNQNISFFHDIGVQARFLVGVPILVLVEVPIGRRLRQVARHFLTAGLIREKDKSRYDEIVLSAMKTRNSRIAELVLLALAYFATYKVLEGINYAGSTWFRPGGSLTLVGYWYALVSLPIWQFLLLRWVYRMLLWSRLLWQVSRMDLVLTPAHPDGAGGLGFLGKALVPFGGISFAISASISGAAMSRILFGGARFQDFQTMFIVVAIITVIIFAGPLLVFTPTLIMLRQEGLLRYGTMASRYTHLFDRRWIVEAEKTNEGILGTEDIQSLSSLGDSYEMIRRMKIIPMELSDFIALALPAVLPAFPLLLTVIPMSEILKGMLRFVA